jgi:hypothetical protein
MLAGPERIVEPKTRARESAHRPALVSLATRHQARARTGTTNDKPPSNHEHHDLRLEYQKSGDQGSLIAPEPPWV